MKHSISLITRFLPALLSLFIIQAPALGQDDAATWPVQAIPLPDLPAYMMELGPSGDTVAVFVGREAQVLLNVSLFEYEVDPALLPIRLIDLDTGQELHRLPGGTDYITDVAFTSTGDVLASYHRNGDIILWDVGSGAMIRTVDGIPNGERLAFMPDGTTLILHSSGGLGMFLVLDTETGAVMRIVREQFVSFGELELSDAFGRLDYQYVVWALSPDGRLLATATGNGEVKLWDMDIQKQTAVVPRAEELGRFNVRSLQFSRDGSTLVYYSAADSHTHFWNIAAQAESAVLPVGDRAFALSADMNRLAWATRTGVWITDVDQPGNASQLMTFADNLLSIAMLAFTPDDGRLLVGGFAVDPEIGREENSMFVITLD